MKMTIINLLQNIQELFMSKELESKFNSTTSKLFSTHKDPDMERKRGRNDIEQF
jgi:hypothetical protein